MCRDRNKYTAAEKLKVIKYAEIHGNRTTPREFSVGESSIREWRKKKTGLEKIPRGKAACHGREKFYSEMEKELLKFM